MKEKIIKSSQYETGNIPSWDWDKVRELNENPNFEPASKPYKFVDKIKSSTRNHGWHFQIEDDYYLAIQHRINGATECVSIFSTDKKQNYYGGTQALKEYITYVDIESAVDRFVNEELGIKQNN